MNHSSFALRQVSLVLALLGFAAAAFSPAVAAPSILVDVSGGAFVESFLSAALDAAPEKGGGEVAGVAITIEGMEGADLQLSDSTIVLGDEDAAGLRAFEFSTAPFAEGSSLSFKGKIGPSSSRPGAHVISGVYELKLDDIHRLDATFPNRVPESLVGPLSVKGELGGVLGDKGDENAPASPLTGTFESTVDFEVFGYRKPLVAKGKLRGDDVRLSVYDVALDWDGHKATAKGWCATKADGKMAAKVQLSSDAAPTLGGHFGLEDRFLPRGLLAGEVEFTGPPSDLRTAYSLKSDHLEFPGVDGVTLVLDNAQLSGRIFDPYRLFNVSVKADVTLAGRDIGRQVFGVRYEPGEFTLTTLKADYLDTVGIFSIQYFPPANEYRVQLAFESLSTGAIADAFFDGDDPTTRGYVSLIAVDSNMSGERQRAFRAAVRLGALKAANLTAQVLETVSPPGHQLLGENVAASSTDTFQGDGTPIRELRLVGVRDEAGWTVDYLHGQFGRGELLAEGRVDEDRSLAFEGSYSLRPRLLAAVLPEHPWLEALQDAKGWVNVPVRLEGTLAEPNLVVKAGVAERFAAAARGEAVQPFAIVTPSSEHVDVPELPNYD